jgi:phosphohistidine phosphatase
MSLVASAAEACLTKNNFRTIELIAGELKISLLYENDELYEASVRTFLNCINEISEEFENVLIVGHNPTITYVADFLSSTPIATMSPGSLIVLQFDNIEWNEISQNTADYLQNYLPESNR